MFKLIVCKKMTSSFFVHIPPAFVLLNSDTLLLCHSTRRLSPPSASRASFCSIYFLVMCDSIRRRAGRGGGAGTVQSRGRVLCQRPVKMFPVLVEVLYALRRCDISSCCVILCECVTRVPGAGYTTANT